MELPLIYQKISSKKRHEEAIKVLEKVGLKDRIYHRPSELSGGQQQRVAIARALVTKPSLILADEPTGNLDTASGMEIIKILHQLNHEGTTIILITHDYNIAREANKVIRIQDGKIVESEDA